MKHVRHILYDMPVSNHGARIRMIIQLKGIQDIEIRSPLSLGGLKSPDFVRLNPEGKMPILLVEGEGGLYPIVESDPIARFLLDRYTEGPSLRAGSEMQRCLGEQLVRVMDQYIGPLQGTMYKAPGTVYGPYGTDRKAGLAELVRQMCVLETLLDTFDANFPTLKQDPYLCGDMSLADVMLYPTMVFADWMLPQFFGLERGSFMGPRLTKWFLFMSSEESGGQVRGEIEGALEGWREGGRWVPIVQEMQAQTDKPVKGFR
ncbi:hypothetical protein B484DRAFT_337195 [Ochromonadaceae sp. CCMP2298]|nr:hypothetical protein B484DRAFT_337195 [Ochromonadaceae sp. CCMP2298]